MPSFKIGGYGINDAKVTPALLNEIHEAYREAAQSTNLLQREEEPFYTIVKTPFRGTKAEFYVKFTLLNDNGGQLIFGKRDPAHDGTNVRLAFHEHPFIQFTAEKGPILPKTNVKYVEETLDELFGKNLEFSRVQHAGYDISRRMNSKPKIYSADIDRESMDHLDFERLGDRMIEGIEWGNSKTMEDPHLRPGTASSTAFTSLCPIGNYVASRAYRMELGFIVGSFLTEKRDSAKQGEFMHRMLKIGRDIAIPNNFIVATYRGFFANQAIMINPSTYFDQLLEFSLDDGYSPDGSNSTMALADIHHALKKYPGKGSDYATALLKSMKRTLRSLPEDKATAKDNLKEAIAQING